MTARLRVASLLGSLGLAAAVAGALPAPAAAQWYSYPEANLPRNADGTFNPNAPVPRTADGKPSFGGFWIFAHAGLDERFNEWLADETKLAEATPFRPWARALFDRRRERQWQDDPSSMCRPTGWGILYRAPPPLRIIHLPDKLVFLFEATMTFREVFLDGRPLPEDPTPSYYGYSVGHWEGDTLVIESTGYNGQTWIDGFGRPLTPLLKLTERMTRDKFGALNVQITIDDPGAYTQPWSLNNPLVYNPDSEIVESYCDANTFGEQLKSIEFTPEYGNPGEPDLEQYRR